MYTYMYEDKVIERRYLLARLDVESLSFARLSAKERRAKEIERERERGEREARERERQEAPLALRPPQTAQTPGYTGVCAQRQGEIDSTP